MVEAKKSQRRLPLLWKVIPPPKSDHGPHRSLVSWWSEHQRQSRPLLQGLQQPQETNAAHGMGYLCPGNLEKGLNHRRLQPCHHHTDLIDLLLITGLENIHDLARKDYRNSVGKAQGLVQISGDQKHSRPVPCFQ